MQVTNPNSTSTTSEVSPLRRGARGHLLLPGGIGRTSLTVGGPMPHVVRGQGYSIWDDQGRELIDANNNFTVAVHGHAHPQILEAAEQALRGGASFGLPNFYEWEHAELLLSRVPGLDQVRYTNSGTEAVMTAIRVARAHTGRDAVLAIHDGYHGTSDVALCAGGTRYTRGVPAGVANDVTTVPINDSEALTAAIEKDPQRYAAVIIDLLPNRAGLISVSEPFLRTARELTSAHGIALIIDEVISFRLGFGGLANEYGVTPDLMTVGKIIGGGLAVGAVIGREEFTQELSVTRPDYLEHGGTFTGNPVSMAAGTISLQLLTDEAIQRLNELGDNARAALQKQIEGAGWEVRGRGSIFRPFPLGATQLNAELRKQLWWAAYDRGVLLTQANCAALSTPMSVEVVADLTERLGEAVLEVAEGHTA